MKKSKPNLRPNSIAIVVPSRGQVFSETIDEVIKNLAGYDYKFFISHDNPIPECFNIPTKQALEEGYEWIWYVEEDMVIPKYFIKHAMDEKYPIVACDYPAVRKESPDSRASTVLYAPDGTAFFTGMGCMLVNRIILEKIGNFTTEFVWDIELFDGILEFKQRKSGKKDDNRYGNQDVHFGITLYANKLPIHVLKEYAGQRRIMTIGKTGINDGSHNIKRYLSLKKNNVFSSQSDKNYIKLILAMKTIKEVKVLPCV